MGLSVLNLITRLPAGIAQGIIWSLMALGVTIPAGYEAIG